MVTITASTDNDQRFRTMSTLISAAGPVKKWIEIIS